MAWLKKLLGTAAFDFGGVIVFYALMKTLGLRAAIIGTLVFVPIDALRRHKLRIGFPRIYVLSTALVLVFGTIDVFSKQPFMLKYEGAVTETVVGIAFAIGSRDRSIIEELVAQQQPDLRVPHHRRFFQLITRSWSIYYLCMACAFLWVSLHFTLAQAIGIRQVAGLLGAFAMALFSFSGRFAFRLFQALQLLPPDGTPDREVPGHGVPAAPSAVLSAVPKTPYPGAGRDEGGSLGAEGSDAVALPVDTPRSSRDPVKNAQSENLV